MRAPLVLLLALVAAVAFALRWAPAAEIALSAGEPDLAPSRWLIDDPHTAYHVRRIELALAGERTPQLDCFVSFPQASELSWSPIFDTFVAAVAQRGLREVGGDPALGGVREARLEDFLVRFPPLVGVATALAVFWAVSRITEGRRRASCALLAALTVAIAPIAVQQSAAGRLDHLSAIALLLAVHIAVAVNALRSTDALSAIFGALVSGIAAGVEIGGFMLGLVPFLAQWGAYLVAAYTGDDERRKLYQRAGLLYCGLAAFVSRLPLSEGPWERALGGPFSAWWEGSSGVVLLFAAPFVLAFLLPGRRTGRFTQTAVFIVALGALAYTAPIAARGIERGWSWYRENRAALAIVSPAHASIFGASARREWLLAATPLCLATPIAWILLAREWRRPERAFLLLLTAGTALLALAEMRFLGLFAVPMACARGAALDVALESASPARRTAARVVAWSCVALLVCHAAAAWLAARDAARREERIEYVKGLRWMRDNTPSPGAWNSPAGPDDWGVIATPASGALVAYHARRPSVVSDLGWSDGSDALSLAARAMLDASPVALVRFARGHRAHYVVVAPRDLRDLASLERLAREPVDAVNMGDARDASSTMLARLALAAEGAGAEPVPGFERVYASARRVNVAGHAAAPGESGGPAVSIYRITDPAARSPSPEIKPR